MEETNSYAQIIQSQAEAGMALPLILGDVQMSVLRATERQLRKCFLETDDMLYEMELGEDSNSEDLAYFDASRALRVKKSDIIHSMLLDMSRRFALSVEGSEAHNANNVATTPSIKLVKGEAFNQNMELKSLATLVTEKQQSAIDDLVTRLNHVLLQTQMSSETLPLNAIALVEAFVASYSDHCDLNINARRILFKQFSKHVLESFGLIITAANRVLIDAGILPNMNDNEEDIETVSKAAPPDDARANAESEKQDTNHDLLTDLTKASANIAEPKEPEAKTKTNFVPERPQRTRHSASRLPEPQTHFSSTEASRSQSKPGRQNNIEASPKNQLAIANSVTEFFHTCMHGEDVPVLAKEPISRLQLPFLQEALVNPSVFTKESHPARRLILQMVSMAIQAERLPAREKMALQTRMLDAAEAAARDYQGDPRAFLDAYHQLVHGA